MSATAAVERVSLVAGREVQPEATLDEVMITAWTELRAHRDTACPICGEGMRPLYGAHALSIGGRCRSCGTELR